MSVNASNQSICLIRLSAIGDVINTASVVVRLLQALPHAKIVWVIGSNEYEIVKHLTGIEFILFNKTRKMRAYLDVRSQLAGRHFDTLLLMQYSLRANLLSTLVHSPNRYGYQYPRSREHHNFFINHRVGGVRQHTVESYLDFARALGIDVDEPATVPCYSDADMASVEKYLDPQRKSLVVSPCASEVFKQWSVEGYARVADYVQERYGMQVILSGSASDRQVCEQIRMNMTSDVVNTAGETSLGELCALIASASLVLSPDSAAVHIASAVGTPVVGLYAATNPQRAGPYHYQQWCINRYPEAVQKVLGKAVKNIGWGTKIRTPGVMNLINESEVTAMIDKIMQIG